MHRSSLKISGACFPDTTRVYEDPYLRYELQGQEHRGIPFNLFLQAVFPEHKFFEISTSDEIKDNLQAYLEVVHRPGTKEKDLYDPFATLISSIIAAVGVSDLRYIQMPDSAPHGAVGDSKRK